MTKIAIIESPPSVGTLPVLTPMPDVGVSTDTPDGAYYVVLDDMVQVVIVGAMHFIPGEYVSALGDLLDTHFSHLKSEFMSHTSKTRSEVLRRGFISLIARKG